MNRNKFEQTQQQKTLEERMAPYIEMIEKLKEHIPQFTGDEVDDYKEFERAHKNVTVNFGEILGFKTAAEYAELITAMAVYEEYELLNYFFAKQTFSDKNFSAKELLMLFSNTAQTPIYTNTRKANMTEKREEEKKCPKCGAQLTTNKGGSIWDIVLTTKCTKCDYTNEVHIEGPTIMPRDF